MTLKNILINVELVVISLSTIILDCTIIDTNTQGSNAGKAKV